jgi:ribosomal protein L28
VRRIRDLQNGASLEMIADINIAELPDSSFWENFLSTLIGTLTALAIFLLERRWEKHKDRKSTTESHLNNMKYFHALIKRITSFVIDQKQRYREHIQKILAIPTEYHPVPIVIAEDLYRLLRRENHAVLFHSFLAIKGNTPENVTSFYKLFSNLDYTKLIYEQANDSQRRYQENIHSAKIKYRDLVQDKIMRMSANQLRIIRESMANYQNEPLYNVLNNLFINYYLDPPPHLTIQYQQENFVQPLRDQMIHFQNIETCAEMAELCRQATYMYKDIIFQSNAMIEAEAIIAPYRESLSVDEK